jgi:hypothetical protein
LSAGRRALWAWALYDPFSAITGPLLWGAIVYLLEGTGALAYRAAVASLLAMLLAGAFVLAPVEECGDPLQRHMVVT